MDETDFYLLVTECHTTTVQDTVSYHISLQNIYLFFIYREIFAVILSSISSIALLRKLSI